MSTINETIAIGKTDRLEIDITSIKYYEDNPYGANAKSMDAAAGIAGQRIDVGV